MTKREFIWLGIRFLGICKLLFSLRAIFDGMIAFFLMLSLCPPIDVSERLIFLVSFSSSVKPAESVVVIIYLLFFAKIIFNIIHRTSAGTADTILEKQNYTEILIRFLGFWWLWKVVFVIYKFITTYLWQTFLLHWEWVPSDGSAYRQFKDAMDNYLHAFQGSTIWYVPLRILLYAILAWYFLKHGKFFMDLLNRLCQKAIEKNHTPVDPVNPL